MRVAFREVVRYAWGKVNFPATLAWRPRPGFVLRESMLLSAKGSHSMRPPPRYGSRLVIFTATEVTISLCHIAGLSNRPISATGRIVRRPPVDRAARHASLIGWRRDISMRFGDETTRGAAVRRHRYS